VITKCWISFLNDNWIYQLFHIAPFKAVPSQLDTMSPANVLLSKAFANILHADLCKCNLQMFFIIADIMKSPSFSANLTCGERKKSHRMLILEVHTMPILTEQNQHKQCHGGETNCQCATLRSFCHTS
jgi:hypothetical protein